MTRLLLKYGAIAGAIVSAVMVFGFIILDPNDGIKYGELLGYSSMILAFSTIYYAIKTYREEFLEGIISFGKAFQIGLAITLIASTIYVISWMIISTYTGDEFINAYFNVHLEKLKASGLTEAEMATKVEAMEQSMEMYKNPFFKAGITYMEIFPVGLIVSLVSALVLKRGKRNN